MHSKKIGTVFSIGLTHCFFVRFIPNAVICASLVPVKSFFDKADLAAAFHARQSDSRKIVDVCAQMHVFLDIVS